ncbi:NADH kinase pos5, partial [Serendipita sp. 407]
MRFHGFGIFKHRLNPCSQKRHARQLSTQAHALSKWISKTPGSILFVKKPNDNLVAAAFNDVASYIKTTYPQTLLFHESENKLPDGVLSWSSSEKRDKPIDLIVTLGGDGTILHASSLFKTGPIPPVLSFSMGTLGFLLPFNIDTFPRALDEVFSGNGTILERMRIACTFHRQDGSEIEGRGELGTGWQVMNEVTLHRGRSPHLNVIDAYVDGQHLTEAM